MLSTKHLEAIECLDEGVGERGRAGGSLMFLIDEYCMHVFRGILIVAVSLEGDY